MNQETRSNHKAVELQDQQRISWKEFCLLCLTMYRQILPGVLIVSGILMSLILLLILLAV